MKITLVHTLIISLLLGSSHQQCLTKNDQKLPNSLIQKLLYNGQQEFSFALLQAINQLYPKDNIFFSPYSTYQALLLAYFISANQTEMFFKKALKLDPAQDKADIYSAYKLDKFVTRIRSTNSSYEFTNANRIFVEQQANFRMCIRALFGDDELITANFQANPEAARRDINEWVKTHTHDMIKNLLPPETIDTATNFVLVSAAYFKGKWESKFDAEQTKCEVFYISPSKRTTVDMMHIESTFNHGVSVTLMAHILELPYEGGDISMYILLPQFSIEDGIKNVLEKLTLENFNSVVNGSLLPRQVQVSLPKFSLERTVELAPILEYLGVGNLFRQDADFSVLTGSWDLSVGEGIHKAKIEVNEEGTKAAAATAPFSGKMMQDESKQIVEFTCNRPFIFLVYNKLMRTILFTGIYRFA